MKQQPVRAKNKFGPARSPGRMAADAAGMSRQRMYQALAVASIPKDELEALIESDSPPSIAELVRHAKNTPPPKPTRRLVCCPSCGADISAHSNQEGAK